MDGAHGEVNGWAADLWTHLPVLGPAVDDGRHLVAALDQATTAATIGVNLIAKATAPGSHLIVGSRVNLAEVKHLSKRSSTASDRISTPRRPRSTTSVAMSRSWEARSTRSRTRQPPS